MSIPHLFRCPISLDIFTDPVTLCTGQTYDRPSIQKWLQSGNSTCPVTMQPLHDTTLVPNHTLRHLIEQWLSKRPQLYHHHPHHPHRSTDQIEIESSLSTLMSQLQSKTATIESKIDALKKVRDLLTESEVGRARLIQLGFFPLLLELIFQSPTSFLLCNQELLELSLDCLLTLSPTIHLNSLNQVLTKDPKFASLVLFLNKGNSRVKVNLCRLLEKIAISESTEAVSLTIGQSPRVMRSVISILDNKSDAPAHDACIRAVYGLCSPMANREIAIKEGVVQTLVKYLTTNSTTPNIAQSNSKALATLDFLIESHTGKKTLTKIATCNLIKSLVKHVFVVSSENRASEHAAAVLLAICRDLSWARGEAVGNGVVTQLLFLMQSQCSSRAKSKARELLLLLNSKCSRCDRKIVKKVCGLEVST